VQAVGRYAILRTVASPSHRHRRERTPMGNTTLERFHQTRWWGDNLFFHHSYLVGAEYTDLSKGDKVAFVPGRNNKGLVRYM